MKWNLFASYRVIAAAFVCVCMMTGSAFAEKSMWQKFKDFFTPGETIDCEGPTCDELHNLEDRINTVEGKYSRERRPMNKERYKKELDSLNVVRDSLVAVIKSPAPASSAALQPVSSSAIVQPTSSAAPEASSSSVAAQPASNAKVLSADEVAALVCKPDTVYVRDTVVVHDTVYVIVTNKPEIRD